jgi:glucose-6-phosphate 1-dehydrogenase
LTTVTETAPLIEGLREYRVADPALMVIFGATGDLSGRKLLPAIYNLANQRLLPPGFAVVGVASSQISPDEFRRRAADSIRAHSRTQPVDEEILASLISSFDYHPLDFSQSDGFKALRSKLEQLEDARHTGGNRIYYCAIPPAAVPILVEQLSACGMAKGGPGYRRIVIEKPFGTDLKSARELNEIVLNAFAERSVYRIDHYLGKETVQNILAFRFANAIFEPIWSAQHVDSVQITVAEDIGIEHRGAYYDKAGALRDVVQNHALQLLTLVSMEPPVAFDADAVRDEKVKVLRAIPPLSKPEIASDTVRGQYIKGWVLGEKVSGYREEPDVAPDSTTETYAALKFRVDNWRWGSTPFYIRAGKRLAKQVTEIRVQFKRPPHQLFGRDQVRELDANSITLRIQPEEGISLRFGAKVPSAGIKLRSVSMDFLYMSSFLVDAPDAYERLLMDCMLGDPTLFTRADEVETAWKLIDPIEESWREGSPPLQTYPAGSWGPKAADKMLGADGREWHKP